MSFYSNSKQTDCACGDPTPAKGEGETEGTKEITDIKVREKAKQF